MTYRSPLDAEMERQGITTDSLAKRIGAYRATVSAWRSGHSRPGDMSRRRIANVLGLSEAEIWPDLITEAPTALDAAMVREGVFTTWLADTLGVHKSQVSRWRSGTHVPHHATQIRIARALDLTPADLGWTAQPHDEDEQVAA